MRFLAFVLVTLVSTAGIAADVFDHAWGYKYKNGAGTETTLIRINLRRMPNPDGTHPADIKAARVVSSSGTPINIRVNTTQTDACSFFTEVSDGNTHASHKRRVFVCHSIPGYTTSGGTEKETYFRIVLVYKDFADEQDAQEQVTCMIIETAQKCPATEDEGVPAREKENAPAQVKYTACDPDTELLGAIE